MFFRTKELPRFIVTQELGRLARWLRLLGFDCIFFDRARKKDLVIESLREERVILTRETRLSSRESSSSFSISLEILLLNDSSSFKMGSTVANVCS